jgi:hypothetical protein
MKLEHEIEYGIPIPGVRGGGPRTELGLLLNTMKNDGGSFLTDTKRATIYSLARYYGITVSVRAEGKKLRVWRLSDEQINEPTKGETE